MGEAEPGRLAWGHAIGGIDGFRVPAEEARLRWLAQGSEEGDVGGVEAVAGEKMSELQGRGDLEGGGASVAGSLGRCRWGRVIEKEDARGAGKVRKDA
ncbi:hypothetical protein COCNU_scaffold009494G000010 [Cocos nucifera]|nr:hypothetical protein [Cocos nucifera]